MITESNDQRPQTSERCVCVCVRFNNFLTYHAVHLQTTVVCKYAAVKRPLVVTRRIDRVTPRGNTIALKQKQKGNKRHKSGEICFPFLFICFPQNMLPEHWHVTRLNHYDLYSRLKGMFSFIIHI